MFTIVGVVVLRSINQSCIDHSTVEAKYLEACKATKEAIWLRKILLDLEVVLSAKEPRSY